MSGDTRSTSPGSEVSRYTRELNLHLFNLDNNEAFACAMYKTKTYFQDEKKQSPKFKDAMRRYEQMTSEERSKVRRNVLRRAARFG